MLVILTVLVVRFAGLSSICPSPPDADSPEAVCRLSSPADVYRPRGRVVTSLPGGPLVDDCRPDMALRLRPKPRGRVCDRSAASPRRPAAYLAVVFRRYTLQQAHNTPVTCIPAGTGKHNVPHGGAGNAYCFSWSCGREGHLYLSLFSDFEEVDSLSFQVFEVDVFLRLFPTVHTWSSSAPNAVWLLTTLSFVTYVHQ